MKAGRLIEWLNNNGFPSMKVTNRKVPAVAYIDDRAIQFNGNYKKLKNFKPYWAKEYYRLYNIVTDETIQDQLCVYIVYLMMLQRK